MTLQVDSQEDLNYLTHFPKEYILTVSQIS